MDTTTIIYLKSTNDTNGNPRRGWLVITEESVRFVDEGYEGHYALKRRGVSMDLDWTEINISASEYKRIKREYR